MSGERCAFYFCAVLIREDDDARPVVSCQSISLSDKAVVENLVDFADATWATWDATANTVPSEEWFPSSGRTAFLRVTPSHIFIMFGNFGSAIETDLAFGARAHEIASEESWRMFDERSIQQVRTSYFKTRLASSSQCKKLLKACNARCGCKTPEEKFAADTIAHAQATLDDLEHFMQETLSDLMCMGSTIASMQAMTNEVGSSLDTASSSVTSEESSNLVESGDSTRKPTRRWFQFSWNPTFMRLTLLHPRVIFQSIVLLPLAAVLGLFLVPVTAILITCTSTGVKGMFQHASGHSVTAALWLSVLAVGAAWAFICNIPQILSAILVPVMVCCGLAVARLCQEYCMYLPEASHYKVRKVRWSFASNWIATFSLLLEYLQLLSIAVMIVSLDVSDLQLNAAWIQALSIVVRPFGAAVDVQFGVACGLSALLLGFLCMSILLTSQPATRVARTTVEKERDGNLAWLKQLIVVSADTLFVSVMSALFAAAEQFHHELPSSGEWNRDEVSFWLRALALVIAFAYACASMLMVIPIQSVYPELWLPKGLDARASPLFSLIERSLKVFLLSSLSLGPLHLPYLRSGIFVAVTICSILAGFIVRRPLAVTTAWYFRVTSYVSSTGLLVLMTCLAKSPDVLLPCIVSWLVAALATFGVTDAFTRVKRSRRVTSNGKNRRAAIHELAAKLAFAFGLDVSAAMPDKPLDGNQYDPSDTGRKRDLANQN